MYKIIHKARRVYLPEYLGGGSYTATFCDHSRNDAVWYGCRCSRDDERVTCKKCLRKLI